MSVKEFIQTWNGKDIKDYSKDEKMFDVQDNMVNIVEFYVTKGHNKKHADTMNKLFNVLSSERFMSTVEKMSKKKSEYPLIPEIAIVFSDLVDKRGKELGEEKVEFYVGIVDKLLKPRVKEIAEKVQLPKELITETLVVLPEVELVNERFVPIYVNKALRKMYVLANILGKETIENMSVKDLKKLFKQVFGKENFNAVLLAIATERRDFVRNFNEVQLLMWSKLSELLLTELSDMKKKSLKNFILDYIDKREFAANKNNDYARRIDFLGLENEEGMEKVYKAAKKIVEKDSKLEKFLH